MENDLQAQFIPSTLLYVGNGDIFFYKNLLKNWFERNIVLVGQLLNSQGHCMTYSEFISHLIFQYWLKTIT